RTRGAADVEWFATAVSGRATAPAANDIPVAPTVNDALVNDYTRRLEASLGKESFEPLLAELVADKARIKQADAVAIASRFYGLSKPFAKSTSRPKAIDKIRERHQSLLNFKRPTSASRS